jgi:tRNA dimethylallyltransferase
LTRVALVGTTASGKSDLALEVAAALGSVEIVSADSMGVYREMDIGTAKPSREARRRVPHHLIDVADPAEEFTVAAYQDLAVAVLKGIAARAHGTLAVGGTGLYVRALTDGLTLAGRFPDTARVLEQRAEEPDGLAVLYRQLEALDPDASRRMEPTNRRRIIRALEVTLGSGRPFSSFGPGIGAYPPTTWCIVGLPFDADAVDRRIEARFSAWIAAGFVEEVRTLARRPRGIGRTARQAVGYRELLAHVEEGVALDDCVRAAVRRTKTLARRQWAWFRRDPRVRWATSKQDALELLTSLLGGRAPTPVGQ